MAELQSVGGNVDLPIPRRGTPKGKDLVVDEMFNGAR